MGSIHLGLVPNEYSHQKLALAFESRCYSSLNAQDGKGNINGRIVEEIKGEITPVPFANVLVAENLKGTTLNFDGEFRM